MFNRIFRGGPLPISPGNAPGGHDVDRPASHAAAAALARPARARPHGRGQPGLPRRAGPDQPVARPKAPMMRQYELVERVRKYNPNTNEELLNRAYVYAMKAHGEQVRASGDPYFTHPLEVAAILTDRSEEHTSELQSH